MERTISDLATFKEHTTGPRALAGLYAFLKLDVVVEAARNVALDFFAHPEIYRQASVARVVPQLAALHARYGYDEYYLSREQRHSIFESLFGDEVIDCAPTDAVVAPIAPNPGRSAPGGTLFAPNGVMVPQGGMAFDEDGFHVPPEGAPPDGKAVLPMPPRAEAKHQFGPERDQLLAATAAFAERVFNTGERPLRDTVGVMAPGFKSYMRDMNRAMVEWCRDKALPALTENTSYKILRNTGIAARFSMEPPSDAWPYREEANGTTLVATICPELIDRSKFIDRQRVALRGAEAIATVLDFPEGSDVGSADVELLISKCYTWYAARGRGLGLPLATVAVVPDREARPAVRETNRGLFSAVPSPVS